MKSKVFPSHQESRDIYFSGKKQRKTQSNSNSVSHSQYRFHNIMFSFSKSFLTRPLHIWLIILSLILLISNHEESEYLLITLLPLCLLFTLAVFKEVLEILGKYSYDVRINHAPCKVWDGKMIEEISTADLAVGDFVVLYDKEIVPADAILLCVGAQEGSCFVDTSAILDSRGLLCKYPVDSLKYQLSFSSLAEVTYKLKSIKGTATVPTPNADFSSFEGKIKLKVSPAASTVKMKNLLLRDSIVMNSPWVLGLVVYVGNETKTWISSRNGKKKPCLNDRKLNIFTLSILATILSASILCFLLSKYQASLQTFESSSKSFFHFVLLFSFLAPSPVFIVIDLAKIVKVIQIQRRLGVTFRNTNVLDDIGKIEYVLTDKTGTVTEKDVTLCMAIFKNQYFPNVEDLKEKGVSPNDSFETKNEDFNEKEHFFMCLAVCNKGYTNNYGESYLTKSADERILISTATILGIKLVKRELKTLTVLKDSEEISFHILGCQSMSEARKKCHIVLKSNSGTFLYIIGSFEAMDEAVGFTQTSDNETLELTTSNKKQGIRQLILAYKVLNPSATEAFQSAYSKASRSPVNRQGRIESLFDELEAGCTYLGLVGLEESVEEDTKVTVKALQEAGVRFWMLSGDSFEGSLSAGISSGIVQESTPVVSVHDIRSQDEFFQVTDTIFDKYLSPAAKGSKMRRSSLSIFNEPLACFVTEKNSFIPASKESPEVENTICGGSERFISQISLGEKRSLNPKTEDQSTQRATAQDLTSMLSSKLSHGNDLTRGKQIHPLVKKLTFSSKLEKDFLPVLPSKFTLIMDSKSLDFAFKSEENLKNLVLILFSASSVLITSVLPSHKTRIADVLKHNFKTSPLFLAAGDGGSDVGMITSASVGCGIVNYQGNQAACACDVVVNDFADLQTLMIEGKLFQHCWNKAIEMSFYPLALIAMVLIWVDLTSDYSGPVMVPFDWMVFYYFFVSAFMTFVLWMFQAPKSGKFKRGKIGKKSEKVVFLKIGALAACQSGSIVASMKYGLICSSCLESPSEALLVFICLVVSVFFTLSLFAFKFARKSVFVAFFGVFLSVMVVVFDSETNENSGVYQVLFIYSESPVLVIHCLMLILFNCEIPLFFYLWTKIFKKRKASLFKSRFNKRKKTTIKEVFKLKGHEFEKCSCNGGEFSKFTLKFDSEDRKLKFSQSILPFQMKILQNFSYAVLILVLTLFLLEITSSNTNYTNLSFYISNLFIFILSLGYSRYFFQRFHSEKLETSRKRLFSKLKLSSLLQFFYQTLNLLLLSFSFFWNIRISLTLLFPSSLSQYFTDDWVLVQSNSIIISIALLRFSISSIITQSSFPVPEAIQFLSIYLFSLTLCLINTYKSKSSSLTQFNTLQQMSDDYEKGTSVLDFLLPAFVRKRVKEGARYIAEDQGEVSVLFCYIMNFDQITNEYSIEELTGLLDEIFGKIDSLCEMVGVTKIETVANTYMACAGLKDGDSELKPFLRNLPHARRAVELAFAILRAKDQILLKNGERVNLKVGIHSGTVTAGVVGFHKPQFSLVGDTVNTASRMASNGEKNTIHISRKTFELIGEPKNFSFKANQMEIKGKGIMETFTIYLHQMVQGSFKENRVSGSWTSSFHGISLPVEHSVESADEKSDLIQDLRLLNSTEFFNKAERNGKWVRFSLSDQEKELVKWKQRDSAVFFKVLVGLKIFLSLVLVVTVFFMSGFLRPLMIAGLLLDLACAGLMALVVCRYQSSLFFTVGYSLWMGLVILTSIVAYFLYSGSDVLVMFIWLHFQLLVLSPLFLSHLILPVTLLLIFLVAALSSQYQTTSQGSIIAGSIFFTLLQTMQKYSTESKARRDESLSTLASREYEKITKLLTQMIPEHVFNHLKDENSVTDNFVQVTVIYADIVGFTPWSSGRESAEIVNMLSSLFTKFDKSSVKNNVYKVHTIGDCYVAMGFRGGQSRDPVEECINVVNFAYSMLKIIKKVQKLNHELNMRIGIHTGDIIGGVMGTNIVRYDIYGIDVLFANSMESNGIPGKIIVSESTKNFLEKGIPKKFQFNFHTQVKILERTYKAFELVLGEGL